MDLITTSSELAAACERLAQHPVITVDTEFLRETTYYPLLCVVQMASPDEAIVIDTLAEGIDLKPFLTLMGDEKVLKVFHAARQDIEIVWHRAGIVPHPIFDTQVAAMVLGYGDSIAYDQLVERITGHRPDKTHRFTDWSRRPLTKEQIHYAVSDVTHLRDVFAALDADLKKRGRADGNRGLARTGGAKPRRPAQPRPQGRRGRGYRHPRTDHSRTARQSALAAEGI